MTKPGDGGTMLFSLWAVGSRLASLSVPPLRPPLMLLLVLALASPAAAGDDPWGYGAPTAVFDPVGDHFIPGELRVYQTIQCIGIEWDLRGDADHDAECKVRFRQMGVLAWSEALPLVSLQDSIGVIEWPEIDATATNDFVPPASRHVGAQRKVRVGQQVRVLGSASQSVRMLNHNSGSNDNKCQNECH